MTEREEMQLISINNLIEILNEVIDDNRDISYKQRRGKNIEGFNLFYKGEKFTELWAFVGDYVDKYHFWTNAVSEVDKQHSISVKKGSSKDRFLLDTNGAKVYNHHEATDPYPRMEYKWEARNREEIIAEINREIEVLRGF